jgi:hypothetical protein
MLLYCNINDESNTHEVSVDAIAPTGIDEYTSSLSEILSIPKEDIDANLGAVESDDDISSNSESDLSTDGGSSANEDTDDDSSGPSYYTVTDDPHFWDACLKGHTKMASY